MELHRRSHKGNIHQTIDEEVLEKRNITFRSTSIDGL